jgi:hypothetical protein
LTNVQAGVQAHFGKFVPASRNFCEAHRAAPLISVGLARRPMHADGPPPALNRIYIDALSPETVTRETLLRYTRKSCIVNDFLVGFLCKR